MALVSLVSCCSFAFAQGAPPPDPYAPPPPPPPGYGAPPAPGYGAPPPPGYGAPPMGAMPYATALPPQVPPHLVAQWKGARVMTGFGGVIGLLSTGLSLSSAIYIPVTGYPPKDNAQTGMMANPKPSDPSQIMSTVSAGSAAFGFALAAGSLGWRHHILDRLHEDPGRGHFIAGTIVGGIGVVAIIASYVIGFSGGISNPRDRGIIAMATSLGGSSLCNMGTAMYAKDSANLTKVWKKLTTF